MKAQTQRDYLSYGYKNQNRKSMNFQEQLKVNLQKNLLPIHKF
jgi:hypothetical protein